MAAKWTEDLSNELKKLKATKNPTQAQINRIYALEDIKVANGQKVSDPYPGRPAATPTTPAAQQPAAQTPAAPTSAWNEKLSDELKNLNKVADPTPKQEQRIEDLKEIKANKNTPVTAPTPQQPAAQTPAAQNPQTPLTTGTPQPDGTSAGGIATTGVTNVDDRSVLDRVKEIIGVGEQFGRGLANEFYSDGSLGRINETLTPEEIAAQARAKQLADTVGLQTDQIKNIVNQQQGILTNAQNLSDIELEALGVARNALPGLDAPEMEALRSQARANINGSMQAGVRDLAKTQARNQVFGAAATAQRGLLQRQGIVENRNLERDLLVKNIDIKQAAQNAFTNLVTNTEGNRASRTNAASGQLANTVLNDESQRNTSSINATNVAGNLAATLGQRLSQLQQYNLGQKAAEKAGQVGSILGGIGTVTGQRGLVAGENFADKQYAESQLTQDKILKLIEESLKKGGSALA